MFKVNNYLKTVISAVFLMLIAAVFTVYAVDKPNPPQNLQASLDSTNSKDIAVKLTWLRDTTGPQPTTFFIYIATDSTENPEDFKQIAQLPNDPHRRDFMFMVHGLHDGMYSFYVTAVILHEGQKVESDPSNFVHIMVHQRPYIIIHPAEPIHGIIGEDIHFQIKAETNADCSINYALVGHRPDSMTIDKEEGIVHWVPSHQGEFPFSVLAYLSCDTNVKELGNFTIIVGDSNPHPFVHIVSKPNPHGMPGQKWIYEVKAETNGNCPITFELLPEHPDSMTIDSVTGIISWIPPTAGVYHAAVRATLSCMHDVFDTQEFEINIGNDSGTVVIKIVSKPPLNVKPGDLYKYKVEAESNIDCPITYSLLDTFPNGMNIDSVTGLISWQTPLNNGMFPVTVKATLTCQPDKFDVQHFVINVGQGEGHQTCAIIQGTAMFDGGDTVKEGVVKAVLVDTTKNEHTIYVGQIRNGKYFVGVNDGVYALLFSAPHAIDQWYDHAKELADATKITVACGDTININISLAKQPEPNHYQVSGKVTAESDGSPVMARIDFIPVEKMQGRQGNEDAKNGFHTITDSNGNYSIKLPDMYSYIAHAVPMANDRRYLDQFYNLVSDPLEADIIVLTSDTSGIDFVMKSLQDFNNGFSGFVVDSSMSRIRARVIAHLVTAKDGNKYNFNISAETDSLGNFSFSNLIPGSYVLLSIPFDRTYIPGYYVFDDFVTLKWHNATKVDIADQFLMDTIIIKHNTRHGLLGIAHVNGEITGDKGVIGKSGDHSLTNAQPIAGAYVYVLDANSEVIDYIFTDDLGNYELTGLGVGTYKLVADKVGFISYEETITTDYDKNINLNESFTLMQQPTVVTADIVIAANSVVYPSPIQSKATLTFDGMMGSSQIYIFNIQGEQVAEYDVQTITGENQYDLNFSDFSSGAYFIRVVNGKNISTVSVRVIR